MFDIGIIYLCQFKSAFSVMDCSVFQ